MDSRQHRSYPPTRFQAYRMPALYREEAMTDPQATHRTTVDIDLAAYAEARRVLGTRGYRDTVNAALREVGRRSKLRHAADLIRGGDLDLVTPEDLVVLRAPRHE